MQLKEKLEEIKTWCINQPKLKKQGISICLTLVMVFGVISIATANSVCTVEVDGKPVAVVKSKTIAENIVNQLIKENQKDIASKPLQKITYTSSGSKEDLVSEAELKQILAEELSFEGTAAGIEVNGGLKLALKDKKTAEQVLEQLKKSYNLGSEYKVGFEQKVAIADVSVKPDKILTVEAALKRLKGESDVPRYYTVKEGDTIWDIANAFNVSPEDLQMANPGFTPERMQIGQKIKMLGVADPIINVVATAQKTVQEDVNLAQQVKKNPNLPFGTSKVIQKGETGLREVTYQIIAVNGLETERKVLNEKTIKEAKPQIIERSAQTMVASRGVRPGGAIISPFGMRNGSMHTGVDLARAYGSTVGAYNSGKVVRAGWYGGYGKCVDINHGNGIVTRYGHLSTISVSVGQTVSRGQMIGKVGSTGRSTGPHLHFEVIVNGTPRNPIGYI